MDPFSHALLGAVSAHALARRNRKPAAFAGAAGALLPDADVLIGSAADPLLTLEYHRHFSHALPVAPLIALIAALAVWLIMRRRIPLSVLYPAAFVGVIGAALLDACTSYGVHLLWPFVEHRYAWNIIAVVDPVMTVLLFAGLVLALRVNAPARSRMTLAIALVYLGAGWVQRERAETLMLNTAQARGHLVERLEVKPTLGNLLLWRSIYLTGEQFIVDAARVGVLSPPHIYPGGAIARVTPAGAAQGLAVGHVQQRDIERFARQSDGFLVRHPDQPAVIGDIRYAMLADSVRPLWGIRLDPLRPASHVSFLTLRDHTAADRQRFIDMVLGRSLP